LRGYDRNNGASSDIRESRNIASAYDYKLRAARVRCAHAVKKRAKTRGSSTSRAHYLSRDCGNASDHLESADVIERCTAVV